MRAASRFSISYCDKFQAHDLTRTSSPQDAMVAYSRTHAWVAVGGFFGRNVPSCDASDRYSA